MAHSIIPKTATAFPRFRKFIVEDDASDSGVGAVPCAFFSRQFCPAEENYDMGNRELLARQEWRHWL